MIGSLSNMRHRLFEANCVRRDSRIVGRMAGNHTLARRVSRVLGFPRMARPDHGCNGSIATTGTEVLLFVAAVKAARCNSNYGSRSSVPTSRSKSSIRSSVGAGILIAMGS